ncbi:MAG: hypothetical protein FGM54_11810 [Chitinophagaceae bacterium]|nr:hypothetical protein [Chitinophagaceae bacterium]
MIISSAHFERFADKYESNPTKKPIPLDVIMQALGLDKPFIPKGGLKVKTYISRFVKYRGGAILDPFPGERKVLVLVINGVTYRFPEMKTKSGVNYFDIEIPALVFLSLAS